MLIDLPGLEISSYLNQLIDYLPHNAEYLFTELISDLQEAYVHKWPITFCGNGGSYCTAEHWAIDLESLGFKTKIFSPAFLTARANDYGYSSAFKRKRRIGKELLIAFSSSGRSPTILAIAADYPRAILLTGINPPPQSQYQLIIPIQSDNDGINEDMHLIIGHCIKAAFNRWLLGS